MTTERDNMRTAQVDGQTVSVGDYVGFKCDIEQGGTITNIKRNMTGGVELSLENEGGFSGEYIGGDTTTTELASDCWID